MHIYISGGFQTCQKENLIQIVKIFEGDKPIRFISLWKLRDLFWIPLTYNNGNIKLKTLLYNLNTLFIYNPHIFCI